MEQQQKQVLWQWVHTLLMIALIVVYFKYFPRFRSPAPQAPLISRMDLLKNQAPLKPSSGHEVRLENDNMEVIFDKANGRIIKVTLKQHKTYQQQPLVLLNGAQDLVDILVTEGIKEEDQASKAEALPALEASGVKQEQGGPIEVPTVNQLTENPTEAEKQPRAADATKDATPAVQAEAPKPSKIWTSLQSMPCRAELVQTDRETQLILTYTPMEGEWIRQSFSLPKEGYHLTCTLELSPGYRAHLGKRAEMQLLWYTDIKHQEKHFDSSQKEACIQYAQAKGGIKELSPLATKEEYREVAQPLAWVSIKQPFFVQGVVPSQPFTQSQLVMQPGGAETEQTLKHVALQAIMASDNLQHQTLKFYFGPNHHPQLKEVGKGFEKNHSLGYWFIRPLNQYLILPLSDRLAQYMDNYLWVLLILVVLLALLQFFFAYQAHITNLKVKALEPMLAELKKRYATDNDPGAEVGYKFAEMELYKKAGISPLNFIIPLLAQTPVFFAMINFVRNDIHFRQLPFLWMNDLSAYDDAIKLPVYVPFLGNSISLIGVITSLLFIASLGAKKQPGGTNWMLNLGLPTFMLVACNHFSSGWWLYRLFTTGTEFVQQLVCNVLVDASAVEQEVLTQSTSLAVVSKKSRSQVRLEKRVLKK